MKVRLHVWACVLVLGLAGTSAVHDEPSRVVHTAQGPVRGHKHPGGEFYAFYSIPYATAPTGPHKFEAPLPPPTWSEIFEAEDKKIICPQHPFLFEMYGSELKYKPEENCLLVNVFVPNTKETDLPVVVYVHGGGFQVGFGTMFTHTSLLNSGKIIVVNFNYRLGPHGFLCLGTEGVPGNAGMKDQVAALRWVQRNIAAFGGSPADVTVAGYSAGAAAVELLLASPAARGLFHRVIPESGSGVGVWSVQRDPLETAKSYARSLGLRNYDDVYEVEHFFKNLPVDTLQSEYSPLDRRDSTFVFAACVEREDAEDPFLVEDPVNIFRSGKYNKLPMLVGFADMEGIMRLPVLEQWQDEMNKNFHEFLPADLSFADDDERRQVAREIKRLYFDEKPIGVETAVGYVNYFSDVMFVYPAYRSVSLQAAAGSDSLYLYVYAFMERRRSPIPYADVTGADHCDQSLVLGENILFPDTDTKTENFKKIKQLLVDIWKNFIIIGNPTPPGSVAATALGGAWRATSPVRPSHVLFNASSELRGALWPRRMALWDRIYARHYRAPVPPPPPPIPPQENSRTEL